MRSIKIFCYCDTIQFIIPEIGMKKKRFGLKLYEKGFVERIGAERLKLLAVIVFFLLSGILYSHRFYTGELEMGTSIAADEIGAPKETTVYAEERMEKLDINTATAEELIRLSGIGEKRAADIITYRETNGGFSCIEDIMQVSGIGEKTFEKIKEEITVGE